MEPSSNPQYDPSIQNIDCSSCENTGKLAKPEYALNPFIQVLSYQHRSPVKVHNLTRDVVKASWLKYLDSVVSKGLEGEAARP